MLSPITVSSLDYERIHALLESPVHRFATGADALSRELDRADVRAPRELPPDVISMNSTVRFTLDEGAEVFEYTLSFPRDAGRGDKARISVLSPIGSALLGLRVGDAIDWQVPDGRTVTLRVTELLWQPEKHGEDLGD
jgi:regulator of nucleoside diphosphate kinase